MAKITTCMLVPIIFIVSVIGLFFASTDPSTWPQRTTYLSASDTKLMSPISTVWCESVVLTSTEHDFVAYRLSDTPKLNPFSMQRQIIDLTTKLDRKRFNKLQRTFYLLSGSVIRVFACATGKQAHLRVYMGAVTRECLDVTKQSSESEEDDSDERVRDWRFRYEGDQKISSVRSVESKCPPALKSEDVAVTGRNYQALDCIGAGNRAVNVNVTLPGNYAVILTNDGFGSTDVRLRLVLDRVTYDVRNIEKSIHTCSMFTPCSVPLTFASRERILLALPSDEDSGKENFIIHSQCRPRIAIFAFLIVLLPVMLFVVVAFIVKGVRKPTGYQTANQMESGGHWRNFVSPLLPGQTNRNLGTSRNLSMTGHEDRAADNPQCMDSDSDPPPYEFIYGSPPPPYTSLNPLQKEGT